MSREVTQETAQPILSKDELLTIFERGGRPVSRFRIGLETEKLGIRTDGQAVPFEGERGIEAILKTYGERFGWKPILDQGKTIALEQGTKAITLEPGGQLELSGQAVETVQELEDELEQHLLELASVSDPLGIRWFSAGVHPFLTLETSVWMPKSRYAIMRKYYESQGGMGTQMMKLTASSQYNMDYVDESDARKKIRVGTLLGPVVAAMMANSYIENGKLNGFCSRRQDIWKYTDPSHSSIQPFFIDGSFSFEQYRDWALSVPMYFTVRDGHYIERTGVTFEQYLKDHRGEAVQADWTLHLTTLFPDVRLKDHLEFRTADATPRPYTLALAAYWIGLLYDATALDAMDAELKTLSPTEYRTCMDDVAKRALAANMGNRSILDVARRSMQIAQEGLARVDARLRVDQSKYLGPLREILSKGRSLAQEGIERGVAAYDPFS